MHVTIGGKATAITETVANILMKRELVAIVPKRTLMLETLDDCDGKTFTRSECF